MAIRSSGKLTNFPGGPYTSSLLGFSWCWKFFEKWSVLMRRQIFLMALMASMVFVTACSRPPIERALKRELLPSEANIVVTNHCQGCHIHADFLADAHMVRVITKYPEGSAFREAKECLECHNLRLKSLFRDERRSTQRPHGQIVKMSKIPLPQKKPVQKSMKKKAEKKKEKKWDFFYLF